MSKRASGVIIMLTFINGRRYNGPQDETLFADAILGRLDHRVEAAALAFSAFQLPAAFLETDFIRFILSMAAVT